MVDNKDTVQLSASKVTIPKLDLSDPYLEDKGGTRVVLEDSGSNQQMVYFQELSGDFASNTYHHFPIVLKSCGSPWAHAVLYLLFKLEAFKQPSPKTLESIANDLIAFRRFIDENSIDYLTSPKRKLKRPTYRYRSELNRQLVTGNISVNTASRRMSSVIGFYRWLERQHDTQFEYPLWQERDLIISFSDYKGFQQTKRVKSTDIAVKVPIAQDDYSDHIQDGGKLHPLGKEEQLYLVKALEGIKNVEMTLAFLIALTTGARIQTVFTLRLKHIQSPSNSATGEVPLQVGFGTGVDTKFQRRMVIFIPGWLCKSLAAYAHSERALKRRDLTRHQFESEMDQYLFLTRSGSPYYIAENDKLIASYRNPPRGVSVRQFITKYLEPEMIKLGFSRRLRFHDLRATYGLNLLEERMEQVTNGKSKLLDILMFIKSRMGHSQLATTERYLEYRKKLDLAVSVQSDFEQYLMELVNSQFSNE